MLQVTSKTLKRDFQFFSRSFSISCLRSSAAITYSNYGQPENVLQLQMSSVESSPVGADELLVETLACPINPSDINQIQGVYPIKPPLPAVGGNEGVAVVRKSGSNVKGINVGDWVIPAQAGGGTWCTHNISHASNWLPLPKNISVEFAATVAVNPCTALRMLQDFETLKEGDVIIQNAANSGVGLSVIQIANAKGLRTINVVRNRPNIDELKKELNLFGRSLVITEEELANTPLYNSLLKERNLSPPKLALNAVGGKNATEIARSLGEGGTMVTYGGMSKQPVTVPTSSLIFKDIKLRGFWMSKWNQIHSPKERIQMIEDLGVLHREGRFTLPVRKWDYKNFKEAIIAAQKPFQKEKQLLLFS